MSKSLSENRLYSRMFGVSNNQRKLLGLQTVRRSEFTIQKKRFAKDSNEYQTIEFLEWANGFRGKQN